MSEENVEIVRRLMRATRNEDLVAAWAAASEVLHPEIEMDTTRIPAPGLSSVYRGLDEVGRFWRDWLDAWGTLGSWEEPELIEAEDQVLGWITQHDLRGTGSGIEIAMPQYGWLMAVRDQKVVRATLYMDKTDAIEAAGLSE